MKTTFENPRSATSVSWLEAPARAPTSTQRSNTRLRVDNDIHDQLLHA